MSKYGHLDALSDREMLVMKQELTSDGRGYDLSTGAVPTYESIVYVLNYYEFVCAGVNLGNLDEQMLRHTVRQLFVRFHDFTKPIIDEMVQGWPKTYWHYRNVVERFRE